VHGEPPDTLDIVRAGGLGLNWLPDSHHLSRNGQFKVIPAFWDRVAALRQDIAKTMNRSSKDISLAQYLDRRSLDHEAHLLLMNYAEGFNAARTTKISSRSLALEEEENNKQFRLTNGYSQVVDWLKAGLEPSRTHIKLNTVVTLIRWKRHEVAIECETGFGLSLTPIRAKAVIVTVPAALLRAKRIRFIPDVPGKDRNLEKLEAGQVCKVVLQFREAFWQTEEFITTHHFKGDRLSDALNFVHSPEDADVPVWWTSLPFQDRRLTAWTGGPKAESLLSEKPNTRLKKVLAALSRTFGMSRECVTDLLESWWSHDWQHDPFSRAAYTYVGIGGLGAAKDLARPVQETLFFAGEATDLQQMGTVAGALRSGKRAARQLLTARD
jgi:monoamine oxidase